MERRRLNVNYRTKTEPGPVPEAPHIHTIAGRSRKSAVGSQLLGMKKYGFSRSVSAWPTCLPISLSNCV
jgi:hypothetical protein